MQSNDTTKRTYDFMDEWLSSQAAFCLRNVHVG